jgi:hypothetical protein
VSKLTIIGSDGGLSGLFGMVIGGEVDDLVLLLIVLIVAINQHVRASQL